MLSALPMAHRHGNHHEDSLPAASDVSRDADIGSRVPARTGADRRLEGVDWVAITRDLDARGNAVLPRLVAPAECAALAALYADESRFRKRIVMERHGFGRGEYQYLRYPLPPLVAELRDALYVRFAPVANRWNETMRIDVRYPAVHAEYLARCHDAGQTLPTPLLLRYGADDYNCLHQDLYGEHVFPLQVAILLSRPEVDFTGGQFVLTEQRPRMQSRPEVVPLGQGDGVVFAVRHRPVQGVRGSYRVNMRHGVSRLHSGERLTLGIIFHDAR